MGEVAKLIVDAYNRRSMPRTKEPMSGDDMLRVGWVEKAITKTPALKVPIIVAFNRALDNIASEKRQYNGNSQYETKWTKLIPMLVSIIKDFYIVREKFHRLTDLQIVNRIIDYYYSSYTKTSDKLSHPFFCGQGEVEKAVRISEIMRQLRQSKFKASKGYLISVGAIFGLLNGKLKDLNTKTFLDSCKDIGITTVEVNTIDDAQLRQVTSYGQKLGIIMLEWLEDGNKVKFGTREHSIAVIDGYSCRFQDASFVNKFMQNNPNSLVIVTVTKPKLTRTNEKLADKIDKFRHNCHHNCTIAPYGNSNEEAMIIVGEYDGSSAFNSIKIPKYTYSNSLIKLFCKAF